MKCLRCGNDMPDNIATCENCGFNIEEYKLYEKYLKQPADPEVPEDQKSSLVDNPVLTLLSGGLSVFFSLLFISASTIVILYLALFILFVFFTFYLSSKPSKVKLRPLRNVGVVFAYFALGLVIFKFVYQLWGLLF
ncbi:MAG: hypothetical protein WCS50_03780 [Bacilli bacterium]